MRWRDLIVCLVLAGGILWGFQQIDRSVWWSKGLSAGNPSSIVKSPPDNTPAHLLENGWIDRSQYRLMLRGKYIHRDPTCFEGEDYSLARVGQLCLPA